MIHYREMFDDLLDEHTDGVRQNGAQPADKAAVHDAAVHDAAAQDAAASEAAARDAEGRTVEPNGAMPPSVAPAQGEASAESDPSLIRERTTETRS